MKSHLSEDTDDENCDDPIRLFDSNINAIYFGSQPHGHGIRRDTESCWTLEQFANDEFSRPLQNSTLGVLDDDLIQTLRSSPISECDISTLTIKLVDCGKFPWYFRKYTKQIMQKIHSTEHSDTENEIDIEGVADDSDDCFIVEDLQNVTNEIIKSDQNCKTIMKRRRDDKELQEALSVKNIVKVDFKRNQGLVGMKITPKLRTNTTVNVKIDRKKVVVEADAKQKNMMVDEKLGAADETLSHIIGTQLIPVTDQTESNTTQFKIPNKKYLGDKPIIVKSSNSQNVNAQSINKISQTFIDNLKTKKMSDSFTEGKIVNEVPNRSLLKNPENKLNIVDEKKIDSRITITEKNTNVSTKETSHVKDVKLTNKYKNDQIKIKSGVGSWIGQLVTNKDKEDIKEIKCTKQRKRVATQSIASKLNKKPRKKTEKQKNEPKSPILHCSTVPKNPKHTIPPKFNKVDTNSNLPKELTKVKKIVDKLSNSNSCNLMHDANRPQHIISKIAPDTKPLDVNNKQALQKESSIIQDKTTSKVCVQNKFLTVPNGLPKNYSKGNKTDFRSKNFQNAPIMTSSQKMPYELNLLRETHQDNVNNQKINTIPVINSNLKAPNKTNKPISNSNALTSTVITPTSESNSVTSNQNTNFPTYYGSQFPIHNALPNRMSGNNIVNNNSNVPVQNRYASAIILKSNNHTNFPYENLRDPPKQPMAPRPQRPINILLSHSQQRARDPRPPFTIFYPPAPSERFPSNFSCPVNSFPNQFHPSHAYTAQQQRNPMQDFYRECWIPQNLVPPPPPPPPALTTNGSPRSSHDVTKSKNCSYLNRPSASEVENPQSVSHQNSINTLQTTTKDSSIIGMNTNGLVKKINIVAIPTKNNADPKNGTVDVEQITNSQTMSSPEDSEVVATKTEMLKELDKLSFVDENINDFKEIYPCKIIEEDKKENTLEVAILSKKVGGRFETLKLTMNTKDNSIQQTKSAKGYSPPILPIPTYQNVLNLETPNVLTHNIPPNIALRPGDPRSTLKNETKPMKKRDFVKCCKRKFYNTWNVDEERKRKEDAKKISLDEYKKRLLQNGSKPEQNKRICKEKYNYNGKRPNIECQLRKKVDCNTETDLGYDSDSTVVL